MKKAFFTELAYVFGVIILTLGTALMEKAGFGMSMVVAPAYIIHLRLVKILPFFSFGMAEYSLQLLLIIVISLVMGKFKKGYLFSFVTAVVYGFSLDICIALIAFIASNTIAVRIVLFVLGMLLCSIGVAFFFHSYFAPEAYELMVKELTAKTNAPISRVKTIYDISSLCVSVILSFIFFGFMHFEGVNIGTLITALVNGFLIGRISAFMDNKFEFKDKLALRRYFE